jgi:hypothetical protein
VYGDGDILVGRAGINQVQKFWQHERRKLFCQTAIIAISVSFAGIITGREDSRSVRKRA